MKALIVIVGLFVALWAMIEAGDYITRDKK